jgi:hypothetical protein
VAGATGRVGSRVVELLMAGGHDVVPMSRPTGVDVVTGQGLADALAGAECVVDVASGTARGRQRRAPNAASEFFTASARNLHEIGRKAGVPRHRSPRSLAPGRRTWSTWRSRSWPAAASPCGSRASPTPADPDDKVYKDGSLLANPHATLAGPTFEAWLESDDANTTTYVTR